MLQILVVANPANTNALMLKEHAPSIPSENITALTRLDHNRALAQVWYAPEPQQGTGTRVYTFIPAPYTVLLGIRCQVVSHNICIPWLYLLKSDLHAVFCS